MAYASGYITVEVDLNDYAGDFEIEFDDITDVIDTAEAHGYSKEDLVDWCFDFGGVSPAKFVQDYLNHDQIVELYNKSISERMDELQLTISNRNDKIRELEAKIAELSKEETASVAY
jgi:hypothetical protein